LITGHAHQGTQDAIVSNGTLIVSTDALGIEVGKLEIEYDKGLDKITKYTNSLNTVDDVEIVDDPDTKLSIEKWKQKLAQITDQKVCTISQALTRSYGEESLLGDMVADAMHYAFPEFDFALTNSGGLREDIAGPNVTIGNLISAFPFPNTIVQLELNGKAVKELLEHSSGLTNGVLQVSEGFSVSYDESLPVGNRVVSCTINGFSLDENKTYKVLTSNFLGDGGDGFLAFKKAISKKDTRIEIVQSMIQYMKTFDTYKPKIQGRVIRVTK
jgi:5'-nucleotidase/UDP-sugar diphosphatase